MSPGLPVESVRVGPPAPEPPVPAVPLAVEFDLVPPGSGFLVVRSEEEGRSEAVVDGLGRVVRGARDGEVRGEGGGGTAELDGTVAVQGEAAMEGKWGGEATVVL